MPSSPRSLASPTSRLHLAYISPVSRLYLACISPRSRLYLACISQVLLEPALFGLAASLPHGAAATQARARLRSRSRNRLRRRASGRFGVKVRGMVRVMVRVRVSVGSRERRATPCVRAVMKPHPTHSQGVWKRLQQQLGWVDGRQSDAQVGAAPVQRIRFARS